MATIGRPSPDSHETISALREPNSAVAVDECGTGTTAYPANPGLPITSVRYSSIDSVAYRYEPATGSYAANDDTSGWVKTSCAMEGPG